MTLILYENDVNLLRFKRSPVFGRFAICFKCEILIVDTWNEYLKKTLKVDIEDDQIFINLLVNHTKKLCQI